MRGRAVPPRPARAVGQAPPGRAHPRARQGSHAGRRWPTSWPSCGAYVDVWKFGWGTAYLDPDVEAKLALLGRPRRPRLPGRARCSRWRGPSAGPTTSSTGPRAPGFPCVEVSRGAAPMTLDEKHDLIRVAASAVHRAVRGGGQEPHRPHGRRASGPRRWRATSPRAPVGAHRGPGERHRRHLRRRRRRAGGRAWPRWSRAGGRRAAGVRGAPQGPAGVVHPPLRAGRQPGQHRRRPRSWAWRRCASGCGPTPSTCRSGASRSGSDGPWPTSSPASTARCRWPRSTCPLTAEALTAHFLGREVYRHTRFVVVRSAGGDGTAVVEVDHPDDGALFSPVKAVEVLALPDECAYVVAPEVDTGIPSSLAAVAREQAPGARCVVVEGRYRHVSFILDPAARSASGWATWCRRGRPSSSTRPAGCWRWPRTCRPSSWCPTSSTWPTWPASRPSARYLLPVPGRRASSSTGPTSTSSTSTRPARTGRCSAAPGPGPSTSGSTATSRDTVDTCPRRLFPATTGDGPLLTKCCLLEDHNADEPGVAVVPWGASLDLVRQALADLATAADPAWAPA